MGQRLNIIVVAEGAIDHDGKSITSESIKEVKFPSFDGVVCMALGVGKVSVLHQSMYVIDNFLFSVRFDYELALKIFLI